MKGKAKSNLNDNEKDHFYLKYTLVNHLFHFVDSFYPVPRKISSARDKILNIEVRSTTM